jgi:uncharacterized membrane protein
MHPFDIKSVLLAKHAQHVVLIHFPIALFIIGVLFDFIAQWTRQGRMAVAAYYNLFVAALATIPAVITGILAWQFALDGQRLKGILLLHLVMGCASTVLIWIVWLIHWKTQRELGAESPTYRLPIEVVAVAIVALTGHLGGFLTGVNIPS